MLLSWRPMSWGTESWKWISKACLTLRVCQCFIEVSSLLSSHKTVCPWLLPFVLSDVGLLFFEPRGKEMASLTGNSVKTRLLVGGSSIDWILIEEQCLASKSTPSRILFNFCEVGPRKGEITLDLGWSWVASGLSGRLVLRSKYCFWILGRLDDEMHDNSNKSINVGGFFSSRLNGIWISRLSS